MVKSMKITKTGLRKMRKGELLKLAEECGVSDMSVMKKDELIFAILEKNGKVDKKKSSRLESLSKKIAAKGKSLRKKTLSKTAKKKSVSKVKKKDKVKTLTYRKLTEAPVFKKDQIGEAFSGAAGDDYTDHLGVDSHSDLPHSYNVTKFVLMVRDPHWSYAYWDFAEEKRSEIEEYFRKYSVQIKPVIRVHDITGIDFQGTNGNEFWDVDIDLNARSWYLRMSAPGKRYVLDLGLRHADGRFFLLARSNESGTPTDSPSDVIDDKWMITDFYEVYSSLIQGTQNLSSRELIQHKLELEEWPMPSSGMFAGASSHALVKEKTEVGKDFFLEVDADFVLYGRTKPDAKLTVAGKPVKLRPDGTFTLRYHFPDGKRHLPVVAVSKDGDDSRKITVNVSRDTE